MATLTVRNLDEKVVRALRIRAAQHGRSAEAEHRDILQNALSGAQPPSPAEVADRLEEFRRRTAGRGSPTSASLLEESRQGRMDALSPGQPPGKPPGMVLGQSEE